MKKEPKTPKNSRPQHSKRGPNKFLILWYDMQMSNAGIPEYERNRIHQERYEASKARSEQRKRRSEQNEQNNDDHKK